MKKKLKIILVYIIIQLIVEINTDFYRKTKILTNT